MRDLVLILPDLYLQDGEPSGEAATLPALEKLLRYAARAALPQGWRSWLCSRVGRTDLAALAPACLAAGAVAAVAPSSRRRVWLAQPVHLRAGLTRVQLAHDGLLRLTPDELDAVSGDFRAAFGGSGLGLHPVSGGGFLLSGLEAEAHTEDPARYLGADISEALPKGSAAAALQRLASEIELWLYTHPINSARARAGLLAVSSLWIWGGGERCGRERAQALPAGFGEDACLVGLWRLCGQEPYPLPGSLPAFEALAAQHCVAVIRGASDGPGLVALERDWFAPAGEALAHGEIERLTFVVNDFALCLRPLDRLKFWRRRRRWMECLR